jgi:hypothetical protein
LVPGTGTRDGNKRSTTEIVANGVQFLDMAGTREKTPEDDPFITDDDLPF